MSRVLKVSASGYYQWRKEERTLKQKHDDELMILIRVLHAESFGSYGARRMVRGLKTQGIEVNIKRIRRLMRFCGIKGKGEPRKKKFVVTTDSNHGNPIAPNELDRQFRVEAPNTHWVSDITYVWTEEGWVYLAVVIDLFSRMVVGWATAHRIDASLVCLALERAVAKRAPPSGLLLHSDRGVQYTCEEYRQLVSRYGIRQSMSRKGNCWDNAVAESFFRALKVEVIKGLELQTRQQAEAVIFEYIEGYYNNWRGHSFLSYKSPQEFERLLRLPTVR